jgi:hypothetical protein
MSPPEYHVFERLEAAKRIATVLKRMVMSQGKVLLLNGNERRGGREEKEVTQ